MPNKYIWNLGFDFNSIQHSNTLSFLQNGLVLLPATPDTSPADSRTPASPADLNPGDTVGFNVFNLTKGATADEYSILGGMVTFTYAAANQVGPPCPFSPSAEVKSGIATLPPIQFPDTGTAILRFGPYPAPAPHMGTSAIFSGLQRQAQFPWWPVVLGMPLENVKDGFLMTVALTVEGPGAIQRTFVVDPEMIVGSAG